MAVQYTDEQKACVEQLVGPVDISAGAGSGKTFTLTQRIASALADPNSGVDDIDQVCAITFTEKAAAELKGRVRSTLRSKCLFDQALKVDSAWISTIHGMCARILRASALDLGLDPSFKIAMGKVADDLRSASLNEAIAASGGVDGPYAELFREYDATSEMGMSVETLVNSLLDAAANVRTGLDGLVVVRGTERPREIARLLLEAYEEAEPFYLQANVNKTNDAARAAVEATKAALSSYLAGEGAVDGTGDGAGDRAGEGTDDVDTLLAVLDRCPIAGALRAKDLKEATTECKAAHLEAIAQALMLKGDRLLEAAIALARDAEVRYGRAKRANALLDNTDLIKGALAALEIPAIHDRFANKFRLVMVDEFQDTDELQLAIVTHLSGEGMRYLCTVGDAQQSIYGFRGADINVYRAYQRELRNPELAEQGGQPRQLKLSRNFRSHRDILAFVKKVCAQPSVFGEGFLDLGAVYDGHGYRATGEPRIQIHTTALIPDGRSGSIRDAIKSQAREIATYFSRMHEAGHALSEMVLLLGATTNADLYAQAIRQAGFPCVIAGGSLFTQASEVGVVNAVVQALANPRDTQSLFEVLSGPVFGLGASDLITLGTKVDEETGKPSNRKLYQGVSQIAYELFQGGEVSPALTHAVIVLRKAQRALRDEPFCQVVLMVLQDSGWIARLQESGAEGMAKLGNVMKAVRLVGDIQEEFGFGVTRTAKRFGVLVENGIKEKPGALNLSGQEAVRIMTIHSSKGLEFPVVAMADFARGAQGKDLVVQRVGGETFVSLKGKNRTLAGKDVVSRAFELCAFDGDPESVTANAVRLADGVKRRAMLLAVGEYEELAEAQRLFYVGATRAKEALGLFIAFKEGRDPLKTYVSTVDDVRSAFFGQEPFLEECRELDYGGSEPALFCYNRIAYADVVAEQERRATEATPVVGKVGTMKIAQVKPRVRQDGTTPPRLETNLVSYSSLEGGGDKGIFSSLVDGAASQEELSLRLAKVDPLGPATFEEPCALTTDQVEALAKEAYRRALELKIEVADEADEDSLSTQVFAEGSIDDEDKATSFGSAFHRLCQIAVARGEQAAFANLDRMAAAYGVEERKRLQDALERWFTSRVYAYTKTFAYRQPELSFSVPLETTTLEGEIDLLCTNEHVHPGHINEGSSARALIVDYKTGGHKGETLETLRTKHGLQACCYAYATLLQGYGQVDVAFVRVEQDDPIGVDTLESVCFSFFARDIATLREVVSSYR